MNIEAQLSISRNSRDEISITLIDQASRIEFVDAKFSLEEFALAITGLGYRKSDSCEVRGLEFVGKKKVTEVRSAVCPEHSYTREFYSDWLLKNCQEDGWIVDSYLGSQSSLQHNYNDKTTTIHYHVYKYE